ncbi:MAG: hypothetical protein ACRD4B_00590, partial [Acidobacteriota bacterium]
MPIQGTIEPDWQNLEVMTFQGVSALGEPEKLAKEDFTRADNVRIFQSAVRKDSGSTVFANNLLGTVQEIFKHKQMDGSILTFAITQTSLFQ